MPDFKHFLPRIFDLLAGFPMGWIEWVALDKLNYGHWRSWAAAEQAAIRGFLLAFWDDILSTPDASADWFGGDYFAALANVYPDFEELLRRWEQADARGQARLGYWVADNAELLLAKRQLPGFHASAERGPAPGHTNSVESGIARGR